MSTCPWLSQSTCAVVRFRVKTEMIRPEKMEPGMEIKGLDYIDVAGSSSSDYKITFYAYKEGQTQFKVTAAGRHYL